MNFTVLLRSIDRFLDRHGRPTQASPDPEAVLADIARRIRTDDWRGAPMRFAMEAAGLAFSAERRDRAELAGVRDFFLAEIPASDKTGFLGAMARIYIETFDAAAELTQRLAAALRQAVDRLGAQWRKLLQSFPDLFDPAKAARAIAERMAALPDIWAGLRELGLREPHAPGLMTEAHRAYLDLLGPRLQQREEIERLFAWLKPDGQKAMSTGAAEAVAAMLRPWKLGAGPEDLKKLLMERLLDLYGHPKVRRNAIWNLVPDDLEGMFLHWLTGYDIRMLFRVLNEVERGHMWADREDFWWNLYEKKRIDEVWVAFNSEGYRAALSKLPRDQRREEGLRRFALQEGERDKSLLIMRIGDKIVVEGTYNFKVHIFDAKNAAAPRLYQDRYDVRRIRYRGRKAAVAIAHLGHWQAKVLAEL